MERYAKAALISRGGRLGSVEVDEAVRRLVDVHADVGRFVISTPVLYPGGGTVSVTVWPRDDDQEFTVTDDGDAMMTCEAAGYPLSLFRKFAREHCARHDAFFDEASMLFLKVSAGRLRAAIMIMADLTRSVVADTAARALSDRADMLRQGFHARLLDIYPAERVHIDAELSGESTQVYSVDAYVETSGKGAVFGLVRARGGSFNATYTKFSDIRRREDAPRLIGVAESLQEIGPRLTLMNSVATLIEIESPIEVYRNLAA